MNIDPGTKITVIPVSSRNHKVWIAESKDLPEGWSCKLVHRAKNDLIPGQPLAAWVLWIDHPHHQVQVSDSNFGFLPISDRMRPRYVSSLRRLAILLGEESDLVAADTKVLSEVKGMFSRCARRDQWDWRAVHLALGEPAYKIAKELATSLGEIASPLSKGEVSSARALLRELSSPDLIRTIQSAEASIAETALPIVNARTVQSRPHSKREAQHDIEPSSVKSTYSKAKLDAANATHAELLAVLADFLNSHGYRVEANQFVDAFTRLKSGPAIFEAKSVTDDNELSQIRQGLSQLYEYRFRHDLTNASLWLLLSRSPKDEWIIDYLEKDRGIHVLWVHEGKLTGPFIEGLLESGSDFMRRQGSV